MKKIEFDLFDIIFFITIVILITHSYTLCINNEQDSLLQCEKCKVGRLSYVDTLNYQDGTTFYRYECDTCGRVFRTEKWRGK